MIASTLINYVADRHGEEVIHTVMYEFPGLAAGGTSSELVYIEIPAFKNDTGEVRGYSGHSEVMSLNTVGIHSDSIDFDIRVLNKGDMAAVETINEILAYEEINKHLVDSDFFDYVVRNRDVIRDNKFYVWMKNDDSTNAMGTVTLELSYRTAQHNT
jgi:hypothetical protein